VKAREARRLALWLNGTYLTQTDTDGLHDDTTATLSEDDMNRISEQRHLLGREMLRRSGVHPSSTQAEAVAAIMNGERTWSEE
jgi:hypothetical protein